MVYVGKWRGNRVLAYEFIGERNGEPMKNKLGIPKPKKSEKGKYKKKAWSVFSRYIRMKAQDADGYVKCYTCQTKKPWKDMDAGHGIGGRSNAVLFDERLVKPQCKGCNIFGGGQYRIFTRKLIDELGLDEYDQMVKNSTTFLPLKENDFKDIYEKYKKEMEEL